MKLIQKIVDFVFGKPNPRTQFIREQIKELEEHGVRVIVSDRGGIRIEFDTPAARAWYIGSATAKLKGTKFK